MRLTDMASTRGEVIVPMPLVGPALHLAGESSREVLAAVHGVEAALATGGDVGPAAEALGISITADAADESADDEGIGR